MALWLISGSVVEKYQLFFEGTYCLHIWAKQMKVAGLSVTFLPTHQTTRRHMPKTTFLTFTAVRSSNFENIKKGVTY
jgi:hypothetical protein